MDGPEALLDPLRYRPAEVERAASGAPETAAGALLFGGALGLVGVLIERRLNRRERAMAASGSVACIALGLFARRQPVPLMVPARSYPSAAAAACYVGAVAATAGGGGHRSPAYFPAVLLTAVGSAIASNTRRASASTAAVVAGGYLVGCARTIARNQRDPNREIWSAASYACGFIGAGVVGSIAGELTLRARVLTDYTERDAVATRTGAGRAELDRVADQVRSRGDLFIETLNRVDATFDGQPGVKHWTTTLATALATLRNADIRLGQDDEHQELSTWGRLRRAVERYNERDGDAIVTLDLTVDEHRTVDAETTGLLLDIMVPLIQNAANARRGRPAPVRVHIEVTRRDGGPRRDEWLMLSVEDNAGGTPVPEDQWRTGLWSCKRLAEEHDGQFALEQGANGVRARLLIPSISSRTRGRQARTYTAEYEQGRDHAIAALRAVTAAQAVFLLLHRGGEIRSAMARLALLLATGELSERLNDKQRSAVQAALAVAAMGAYHSEQRPPLGGWAATLCAGCAARGAPRTAIGAAAAGMVISTWRAGEERFGTGLIVTCVDRQFTFVGAGSGMIVWNGLRALDSQETRLGNEAWRRKLLLDLARPALDNHHFLAPLERAIAQTGPEALSRFRHSGLGRELYRTRQEVLAAQRELTELLRVGDPLVALQEQLARLLQPAYVAVLGKRPDYTTPDQGREIDAISFRLGLIGLGQAIAQTVRFHLPPSPLGRSRLRELRLVLEPYDEHTKVDIVQIPFAARDRDRHNATLDAAARDAGGRAQVSSKDRNTVYIHNSALQ